MNFEN